MRSFQKKSVYLVTRKQLNNPLSMKTPVSYFGTIDSDTFHQSYGARITLENHDVFLDLNFYTVSPESDGWANICNSYLENLSAYKQAVETAILKNFKENGEARKYINFHLKELSSNTLKKMMHPTDASQPNDERLLSLLQLKRIGFYPGDSIYAVWNYTLGWQYTDQLLVGNTDNRGLVKYISWES